MAGNDAQGRGKAFALSRGRQPGPARAAVALATGRAGPAPFEDVPFPARAMTITPFPLWPMSISARMRELARELAEMRCPYDHRHWLDSAELDHLVPGFRMTSPSAILAQVLPAP